MIIHRSLQTAMEQCGEFPLRQVETPLSLAADYALTPVCFGTGFLGCAFIVLVLNRAEMRRDNATNVFLTALAVMDLLTLITRSVRGHTTVVYVYV